MKNIIVCGLIGAGKTTLAKKVSQNLNYDYIDLTKLLNIDVYVNDREHLSKKLSQETDNCKKYYMDVIAERVTFYRQLIKLKKKQSNLLFLIKKLFLLKLLLRSY